MDEMTEGRTILEWQTLCRNKISFAMLAGGPVSRNGFPKIYTAEVGIWNKKEKGIREATKAKPDSWESRDSSMDMIESQRPGMNMYMKRRAARELNAMRPNMVAERQCAPRSDMRRDGGGVLLFVPFSWGACWQIILIAIFRDQPLNCVYSNHNDLLDQLEAALRPHRHNNRTGIQSFS